MMERSIFSARYCFVENMRRCGTIQESEFQVLDQWFQFATAPDSGLDLGVDLIIYLRTTPEKALERINIRNRSEENSIPLEYLTQLHQLHEEWLVERQHLLPAQVITLQADRGLEEMKAAYSTLYQSIASQAGLTSKLEERSRFPAALPLAVREKVAEAVQTGIVTTTPACL